MPHGQRRLNLSPAGSLGALLAFAVRALAPLALASAFAAPPLAAAADPAGTTVPEATLARARVDLDATGPACRAAIAAQLRRGERDPSPPSAECAKALDRVLRSLARARPRPRFGLIEGRHVDLAGASFTLSVATHCRRWLLRRPGNDSPIISEARAAGCRIERLPAPLRIDLVGRDGHREYALLAVDGREGHFSFRFDDLEDALARRGLPPLATWRAIEIGAAGWVATVGLDERTAQLAELHRASVRRGRGSPRLALRLHPDDPDASSLRALADEARAVRLSADYQAVIDGTLPPRRFLDRHPGSRFTRAVIARELVPTLPVTIERDDSNPPEEAPARDATSTEARP